MDRVHLTEDVSLSRIVYGTMRLVSDAAPEDVPAMLGHCLDHGITTFDLADIYGGYTCEAKIGAALKDMKVERESFELIGKSDIVYPAGRNASATVKHYNTSRDYLISAVETALSELGTDYLDLFLIHRPDPLMDADETGRTLDELVAQGKLKSVGVSNFLPHDVELLQSRMDQLLVANQIEISLAHHTPLTDGQLAYAQMHRMSPMAWSPLGGGALFDGSNPVLHERLNAIADQKDCSSAAVALAWLMAHPSGILPILGTNNPERVTEMSRSASISLDRETWYRLYEASLGQEVP